MEARVRIEILYTSVLTYISFPAKSPVLEGYGWEINDDNSTTVTLDSDNSDFTIEKLNSLVSWLIDCGVTYIYDVEGDVDIPVSEAARWRLISSLIMISRSKHSLIC